MVRQTRSSLEVARTESVANIVKLGGIVHRQVRRPGRPILEESYANFRDVLALAYQLGLRLLTHVRLLRHEASHLPGSGR